mmetsp:Transcript_23628/g.66299  ORF Transcript_23628/g.66299 Transcript_23628/m.66299 type:complete len:501 (+) Transcript_23628:933-2435(+)
MLEDHEVDERRERARVVRGRGEAVVQDALEERPVGLELVRVPHQAELEIYGVCLLPLLLRLDGSLRDVPSQTFRYQGLNDARVDGQVARVARQARPHGVRVPERLAQHPLVLEAVVEVASDQPEGDLAVVLQLHDQRPELHRVDERLRLVGPLALRQRLRQLVRDDPVQHEVVQAVRQLLAHDVAEVVGHIRGVAPSHLRRRRAGAEGADDVVGEVQDGRVLDQDLAYAVAVDVVVLHVLGGEGLHPVDQGGLLDDVHRRVEVEPPLGGGLEVAEVQVRVREAVLGAREHAGVDELVPGDLPLLEHGVEVDPVEDLARKIEVDDHGLDSVEEEAWRPEDGLHDALLGEVRELCAGEVRRLQALVPLVPEVVVDEVDEVAVDAARGHGKTLLGLTLLALGEVAPRLLHLCVHAAHEHRVLRSRRDPLEHEERRYLILPEGLELLVDEAEDPRRDTTEGIGEGVLQRLDRPEPMHRIDPNPEPLEGLELASVDELLLGQVGL